MSARHDRCSRCNAPIIWLIHIDTGKLAPIDAVPVDDGPIVLAFIRADPAGIASRYRILTKQERADASAGRLRLDQRFTNHFQTCPHAADFRRQKAPHA